MEKIDKEGIKNPTLEDLKDVSVDLTSVSLEGLAEGSYKFDEKFNNLPDNSWGTQNGVILYKTEGRVFATPYNSKTIEKIRETELPENINSIPNINDLNVWGGG